MADRLELIQRLMSMAQGDPIDKDGQLAEIMIALCSASKGIVETGLIADMVWDVNTAFATAWTYAWHLRGMVEREEVTL